MATNVTELPRGDSEPFGAIQLAMYHETPEDAARALGDVYVGPEGRGIKALAARLRPNWPGDKAHRWFLSAVNNDRDEKFSGSDWLTLLKVGRELGVHTVAHHFNTEAGYEYRVLNGADAEKRRRRARKRALLAELAELEDED